MNLRRLGSAATVAALLLAPVSASASAPDPAKPVVTGAVQVTDNPSAVRAHITPVIARNPKTGELVVGEVDGRGTRECVVHLSADGGRSWSLGGGFMIKPFTDCSIGAEFGNHVVPFFDSEGTLNVAFSANDPARLAASDRPVSTADVREDIPRNAYLARSTDGGRTFTTTLVAAGKEGSTQTAYIYAPSAAVDPVHPENIYVGWGQGDWSNEKDPIRTMVAASTDGGRTFGEPVEINNKAGADYSFLTVDRKGVVHATYWSRGVGTEAWDTTQVRINGRRNPTPLVHAWSVDKGKTWERNNIDAGNQRVYRAAPIVADPTSDALYAVWHQYPDPLNFEANRDSKDRVDVYFSASFDGGRTWSKKVVVNEGPQSGVNHELPGIAVAPNGRIDVAWYDYRYSPRAGSGAGIQDVFYASSTDQGRTFGPNIRITDRSIDRSIGVYAGAVGTNSNVGITSTDSAVYFAWQDSRNGRPNTGSEDIYTASLLLDRAAAVTGELPADDDGVAGWVFLVAGVAMGAGLAGALVWAASSRSRSKAATVST
ncbi:MAG TPA: sialidase family protein [Acidimicrobiales bacterium]|nr:sialidase family protein [Acidimicrobiales bacterium]